MLRVINTFKLLELLNWVLFYLRIATLMCVPDRCGSGGLRKTDPKHIVRRLEGV